MDIWIILLKVEYLKEFCFQSLIDLRYELRFFLWNWSLHQTNIDTFHLLVESNPDFIKINTSKPDYFDFSSTLRCKILRGSTIPGLLKFNEISSSYFMRSLD